MDTAQVQTKDVSSFKEEHKERLFESDTKRDQTETKYNFGDQDLEFFSAKV